MGRSTPGAPFPGLNSDHLFRDDLWSTNLRFGWQQAANAGLLLVCNDSRGIQARRDTISDRSLLLKFSWLFDLLD